MLGRNPGVASIALVCRQVEEVLFGYTFFLKVKREEAHCGGKLQAI